MRLASKKNFFSTLLLLLVLGFLAAAKTELGVPAVDANGEGILTSASVDVKPGAGEEFVNIVPFFSVETQQSTKAAVAAAASLANADRNKFDYFIKIVANAEIVDGPSGGAAIATMTFAELTGKRLRKDITITGSITSDGGIGKVGGIFKKAEAAARAGLKVFVVPAEQAVQDGVDLSNYAPAKWGMQVVEARKLEDVVKIAFTAEGTRVEQPNLVQPPLVLEKLGETAAALPLKKLSEKKLAEAREAIGELRRRQPDSPLINASAKDLNLSQYQLDQGYYYSSANTAFLVLVGVQAQRYANASKNSLVQELADLEEQAKKAVAPNKTTANLEWAYASELRKYWALQRLSEARDKLVGQPDPAQLTQSLTAAANWLSSVAEFGSIAGGMLGGEPLEESKLRALAGRKISEAANVTANSPDSEGLFHLATARRAFSNGAYLTAAVDAGFATAFGRASKEHADETAQEALGQVRNASHYYKLKSAWAQLYFAHALYNRAEFEKSGDTAALLNALKLQELSLELEELLSEHVPADLAKPIQAGAGEGRAGAGGGSAGTGQGVEGDGSDGATSRPVGQGDKTLEISVVTTLPASGGGGRGFFDTRTIVVAALLLLVLSVAGLLYALQKKRGEYRFLPHARVAEMERRLEALDELLVKGKISEKNYDRLRAKYSTQLKQLILGQKGPRKR